MSDFAFEIVGDASKANKAIDQTIAKLERIPPAAYKAGMGIEGAASRAAALVAKLTAEQDKHNAAMQRETQMLQAIRGPMNENIADMQALISLYSKGAINAYEYSKQVERLKNSIVATHQAAASGPSLNLGSIAGSLPGGSIIAGAVGGGVAGAAQAGLQSAVQGAGQIIEIADAYTGLNNRLKALTGSQQAATELFDKLNASANRTYSDVNVTTAAFIRMKMGLQGLGVSQDAVLKFTEHLNEEIALSGTDAQGAQAALMQLGQALSAGALRGDEFNSIIEQAPALLEPIAQKLGVSTGQLRAMAEQGKLTSQVIFDAYEGNGGAGARIERAFGEAVPTVAQQFQVLKNEAFALVGQFAKDAELGAAVAVVFDKLKDAAKLAGAAIGSAGDLIGISTKQLLDLKTMTAGGIDTFKELAGAIDFTNTFTGHAVKLQTLYNVALLDAAKNASAAAHAQDTYSLSLGNTLHSVSDLANKLTTTLANKGFYAFVNDPWFVAPDSPAKIHQVAHELDLLAQIRARLAYEEAKRKREGAEQAEFDRVAALGQKEQAENEKEQAEAHQRFQESIAKNQERVAKAKAKQDAESKKAADDLAANAKRVQEAWAGAAGSIAADLFNAFEQGNVSADKLLRKAALLALSLAATQIGGPSGAFLSALVGGIGGGANGFDYLSGHSKLGLPGFASGGDMLMRGSGGTDSQLAMWWMTPGESLHVRTPEQRRQASEGSAGGNVTVTPTIKLLMPRERRDIVDDSRSGMTTLVKLQRQANRSRR